MRKEQNSISSKDFRRTSGNYVAWQSTRGVNPGHSANGQLRISGRVWTSGALATPDREFRLLAVKRTRNTLLALKTASVLGLLILSLGSVAASQQNSPGPVEQGSTTPAAVFGVSGVVLDRSNAAIAGARMTLHGGSLENQPSPTPDLSARFPATAVTPARY